MLIELSPLNIKRICSSVPGVVGAGVGGAGVGGTGVAGAGVGGAAVADDRWRRGNKNGSENQG